MARSRANTPPAYRHHKPRNAAKVTINRTDIYLGRYKSPESYEKYARVLALLRIGKDVAAIKATLNGETIEPTDQDKISITTAVITVGQLSARYWTEYASEYFKSSTGLSRGRVANVRSSLRAVNDLFANLPIDQFSPVQFRDVRNSLVERGLARKYVNDLMGYVVDLFRWGVEYNLVPVSLPQALREVKSLRKGKTAAHETEPVEPVDLTVVEKTLPKLSPVVCDMVQLQLLIAARPIEVCTMRIGEITIRTDGVWCYRPLAHKTSHRGKERRLFIGPKAQAILHPYLSGAPDDYVFKHMWKGQPKPYVRENYTQAIVRACRRAGVPKWTANQLRHARATEVRAKYDLETASAMLGHSHADVTQIYAQTNFEKAAKVASQIG